MSLNCLVSPPTVPAMPWVLKEIPTRRRGPGRRRRLLEAVGALLAVSQALLAVTARASLDTGDPPRAGDLGHLAQWLALRRSAVGTERRGGYLEESDPPTIPSTQ